MFCPCPISCNLHPHWFPAIYLVFTTTLCYGSLSCRFSHSGTEMPLYEHHFLLILHAAHR